MSGYEDLIASKGTEAPAVETPPVVDVAPEPALVVEPASSEVQAPPAVETPPVAAAPVPEPQDHSVPLNVLLRTREEFGGKLSAAEQRAQDAERKLAEIDRQRREAAAQAPDILADPDAYIAWSERRTQDMVRQAVSSLDQRYANDRQEISRVMVEQHLGPEKFAELSEAIKHAPQWLHDKALKQPHPWGYMLQEFNRVKEHKRAQEALSQLGEKSLQERIEEAKAQAIAEARAQWEAEHGGGQPQPATQPVDDSRARNPDGTFAPSTNQTQRHQPPSLSVVTGAPAPRGADAMSGYDMLTKKRG